MTTTDAACCSKQRRRLSVSVRAVLSTAALSSCLLAVEAGGRFRAIDVLNKNDKKRRLSSYLDSPSPAAHEHVQELFITQPLDHFESLPRSRQSPSDFQQRYFYSDRYAKTTKDVDAPPPTNTYAFLCVGGEGPALDKSVLVDSVHCSGDMLALARMLHTQQNAVVHLFALEHRYYGNSYPLFVDPQTNQSTSPVTNQHLVHLSSRQALADIADFVNTMNGHHDLIIGIRNPPIIKWITFGGSYPGMLAAWARLEYPSLIHAAVSNSAPVQATLDFHLYNHRVAYDLQYETIGGSTECLNLVKNGHQELARTLRTPDQYESIASLFDVCNATSLSNIDNVRLFLGDGVIEIPAQSNDPSCDEPLCNIDKLCQAMLYEQQNKSSSTPMQVLASIARLQRAINNETDCLMLDWNATLNELASPNASRADGLRSWLWQTCSEFGFYQTCEMNSMCPFGQSYHPLSLDLDICNFAFGVDSDHVRNNVKRSLDYYGGWNMSATRILSVNGDCDPWSALAMTTSVDRGHDEQLPTHWVKGASHHFWTHSIKRSDGADVEEARILIFAKVMQWLEEAPDEYPLPSVAAEKQ